MSAYQAAHSMLQDFFKGLYRGDVELLRTVFHPEAVLIGDISGVRTQRALDTYLESVAQRQSPRQLRQDVQAQVQSLGLAGDMGSAVARVSMLGFQYTDFLNLVRHEGRWTIAHKLYTHTA